MSKKKSVSSPYPTRMRGGERGNTPITYTADENLDESDTEIIFSANTEELDNTVTWQRIKELVVTMKDSINENTNQAIGEIKSEVTQLKTQMEKYNDKIEDVQGRMCQVEENFEKYNDTVEEVQVRVSQVEDKVEQMAELRKEVAELKKFQADHVKNMNMEACRVRRNNIIINGIPGTSKDKKDAKKAFKDFIIDGLELGMEWLKHVELEELYRFPAKKDDDTSWPLFVRVEKLRFKDEMYRAAFNLKDKGISMRNDLAPWLLVERSKLYIESKRLKESPHNLKTRMRDTYDKVWLEVRKTAKDDWKTWDGKM